MFFRFNNCFLLSVYTIHLSLITDLVDPPPMGAIYMKLALAGEYFYAQDKSLHGNNIWFRSSLNRETLVSFMTL